MKGTSKKTEIRFAVESGFLKSLEERLDIANPTDLTRVAFSLLNWASKEVNEGRAILSTDQEGNNAHRLVMPELANIKARTMN